MATAWFFSALLIASARAQSVLDTAESKAPPSDSKPFHATLAVGAYSSLGGPAPYGASVALDVLPGSFAGRFGVRGEWRSERFERKGSALIGLLYQAGSARPQLALNLVAEVGITDTRKPIVGVGVETSLWLLGPLGVSVFTDLQVIVDGLASRPALSLGLALHIGR